MNFTFRFRDSLAAILFIISFTSFNSVSAGTFTVFGPEFFQRDAGAPVVTVAENFPVFNPNTTFTLKLNNNLVSSAIVLVNNTEILGPNDFSQQVQLLTRTVLLNTSNQLSAELNGEPGNNFTIEIVGIDNDLPLITATVTPQPASNGWNTTTPVTVSFECSDAISGIKDCPVPVIVNKEGAGQVITGTATDNAGNSTPISIVLNIDKTAPTLNIVSPAPGSVLSTNPPQITVEYSDNVAIDPSSLMFSVDGQTMQVTCQATSTGSQCTPAAAFTTATVDITVFVKDMAGNSTSAQASYVIDSDNDGVPDVSDLCPNTAQGDPADTVGCPASQSDLDNDGQINDNDVFPLDPKEWADLDKDGIGDNSDPDIDGDGVVNESDAYPADPTRTRLPIVKITSPSTLTTVGSSPVEVKGSVDTAGTLTVNGVVITPVDGLYTANVALEEGHNTVVTRLVAAGGVISTASISVSLDLTPPYVTVESHKEGQIIRTPTVAISGLVNDIVRGTVEGSQANVTVNGVQATISNRSYLAVDIPLVEGENIISIVAADQVGNSATKTLKLIYQPTVGKHLEVVSGQGQTALIKEILAQPLSIKVLDDVKQPVANKNVVFRVTQGSGILGVGTALAGRGVVVKTDAAGIASTKFQLGQRSGTGNHKVRARVVGYDDEIIFYASATANIGDKLSVNSGNNQRGGTHQPLPAPFVIAVTDAGTNVVKGARVRFDVINGGGHFENDNQTLTVVTDSDGRASAHYSLGGITGLDKQTVTATLLDGPVGQNITAGFSASGFTPGPAGATSISGIVVDNQDKPIPGITIRVDGTTRQAVADQSGQFKITEVPVGPVHLIADGSTATVEGEFPSLSYNIVTVSGVNNPLASPIFMVKLNTANAVYAGLEDVEITLAEVPGFKLEIAAGSVTFPDGSKEGQLSVTAVNANKVPMPAPNGMQPQLIVTIQPTGATFDPPAPLTLPNVDAHTPGAQVEMFSYDHDLEEFVAIGLGTVSEDGRLIKTNTGIGVIKAGWHCGAQPGGDGCCTGPKDCNDYCLIAQGTGCDAICVTDENKALEEQVDGDCSTATCGGSEIDESDSPIDNPNDCIDEVCVGPPTPDNNEKPEAGNDCKICSGGGSADAPDGGICDDECGACENGGCVIADPDKQRSTQTTGDCKIALCVGSTDNLDDKPANPYHFSCSKFNAGNCSWDINPATDQQKIDDCNACQGGQKTPITGSCPETFCRAKGTGCENGECTQGAPRNEGQIIPGSLGCAKCSAGEPVAVACTEETPPPLEDPETPITDADPGAGGIPAADPVKDLFLTVKGKVKNLSNECNFAFNRKQVSQTTLYLVYDQNKLNSSSGRHKVGVVLTNVEVKNGNDFDVGFIVKSQDGNWMETDFVRRNSNSWVVEFEIENSVTDNNVYDGEEIYDLYYYEDKNHNSAYDTGEPIFSVNFENNVDISITAATIRDYDYRVVESRNAVLNNVFLDLAREMYLTFQNAGGAPLGATIQNYGLQYQEALQTPESDKNSGRKPNLIDNWTHGAGADFDQSCNTTSLIQYEHRILVGNESLNTKLMASGVVQEKLSNIVSGNLNFKKRLQDAVQNKQFCPGSTELYCFDSFHNDIDISFFTLTQPDLKAAIGDSKMEVTLSVVASERSILPGYTLNITVNGEVYDMYDFNLGKPLNTDGAWVQLGYMSGRQTGKVFVTSVPFTLSFEDTGDF